MTNWRVTRRTDEYIEMTDIDSGRMKKVALATDKQWGYYESLKSLYSKRPPLKHRPTVFACSRGITKMLEAKQKAEQQQKLF